MKPFKFFIGIQIHCVPIITWDTNTTYHVPIELYGNVLELGLGQYRLYDRVRRDGLSHMLSGEHSFPINFLHLTNEIGPHTTYQYRLIKTAVLVGNWLEIYYQVKLPLDEFFCNFRATAYIS